MNISPVRILAATTLDDLQASCFAFSDYLPVSVRASNSFVNFLLFRRRFLGKRVELQGCEKRTIAVTDAFSACLQVPLVVSGLQGGTLSGAKVVKIARAFALFAILQIALVLKRVHTLQLKR